MTKTGRTSYRRSVLGSGLVAIGAALSLSAEAAAETPAAAPRIRPSTTSGGSEWGYQTYLEPTPQPVSVRAGEATLPTKPRPYTAIKSYHAHIYFDEDSHYKAARLRQWVSERFDVELGNWNLKPRGPHVTPSFYFGFTLEQLPIIVPWLQLNSLGLTILIHPNSDNPRADHLDYALWVNRSQPVNAYGMKPAIGPQDRSDIPVYPNTRPSVPIEI